ncbi:hypothetical protein ACWFOB_22955 [Bacillus subtilis]
MLVPRLCRQEVLQRQNTGPQPTHCGLKPEGEERAHNGSKTTQQHERLLREWEKTYRATAAAGPKLSVVREPDAAVAEEAAAAVDEVADDTVEASAVEVSGLDAIEAVRAELAAAKLLADDSAARVSRAAEGFTVLVEAVARERAELEQRCNAAEAAAAAAREDLEQATLEYAQQVKDAEAAQRRAEGRAQELSEQLGTDWKAEVEQVVAATLDRLGSRRGAAAGERLTKPQRDMLLAIGNKQKRVDRAVAQQSWYVDGQPAGSGAVKTLNSLLQRQMLNWGEDDGSGFSVVHLVDVGVDYFRATTGRVPSSTVDDGEGVEAAGRSDLDEAQVGEVAASAGRSDLDEAPAGEAAAPAGWKPEPGAIDRLLHRVAAGGVSRGGNRVWLFAGGVTPPTPAIQHLDYMLERDLIAVGDGHPAVVYVVEGATSSR